MGPNDLNNMSLLVGFWCRITLAEGQTYWLGGADCRKPGGRWYICNKPCSEPFSNSYWRSPFFNWNWKVKNPWIFSLFLVTQSFSKPALFSLSDLQASLVHSGAQSLLFQLGLAFTRNLVAYPTELIKDAVFFTLDFSAWKHPCVFEQTDYSCRKRSFLLLFSLYIQGFSPSCYF